MPPRSKALPAPAQALPKPMPLAERPGNLGFEIVQPLHWLSRLQHVSLEFDRAAGRALALAIGGSWPSSASFSELRSMLDQARDLLDRAERMDAGAVDAKGEVASFSRTP